MVIKLQQNHFRTRRKARHDVIMWMETQVKVWIDLNDESGSMMCCDLNIQLIKSSKLHIIYYLYIYCFVQSNV